MAKNTVIVSILGDTRDLQRKMGGAGGVMGKFAKVAAAATAIAGAAVVGLGVKAVKSASELEQNMGAMESVFKSSAGQMTKWATTAASTVGLAKSEYAGLATVLGSQLKNMGVAQAQLGGQTDKLIGLGADLAAQFGGSTSDAVSALSSLLRGERDPIERYGVSINEAAVKAKMAEMGLSGLTGEAEKNAKLSATLALLYDQTADAAGAFARESTTLAGAQQRLAAGAENLYATLGTSLLPAVTAVTAAMGQMVNKIQESEWFQALTQNLTNASNAFADFVFGLLNGTQTIDFAALFSGLLPAISQGIQNAAAWLAGGGLQPILAGIASGRNTLLDAAVQLFTALAEALPEILPALAEALVTFIQDLVTFIVDSAPVILGAAVQMFTALVQSLTVVLPQLITTLVGMLPGLIESLLSLVPMLLDAATQMFTALVDAIPIVVPQLITTIVDMLPVIVTTVLDMIPAILDAAINLFTAIIDALPIILPVLVTAIIRLVPTLIRTIIGMVPKLLSAAVKLFTALVTAIPKIIPALFSALGALGAPLIQGVKGLIPKLVRAGGDLIAGLARGLRNNAGKVVNGLLGIARGAINAFKNFFGINSPSKLMQSMGGFLTAGLGGGITRGVTGVRQAVRKLNTAVTDTFDVSLDAPPVTLAAGAQSTLTGSSAANGSRVYQITVQALGSSYEIGKAVVDAIHEFERVQGGRGQTGGLA